MSANVCSPSVEHVNRAFCAFPMEGSRTVHFPPAQSYPPRTELFRQGDLPDSIFLLEQGLVKLVCVEADGNEVLVGLRAAGWFVGSASVVLQRPYPVSAVTVVACRASRMWSADFRRLLHSDSPLSWQLHVMQSNEVDAELEHVAELNALPALRRFEQFLRRLARALQPAGGDELRVTIPLRQREIAQLIGVTAPYLSELTRELEVRGWLRREKDSLVLLHPCCQWAAV
jgi:CRP/FNR family transcriptional regulator